MVDKSEKTTDFPYNVVNGVCVPLSVTQEHVDKLKHMKVYSDDVWVASFPRCGSTWTRWIVRLIHNRGQPDDQEINDISPYVDVPRVTEFVSLLDDMPRPRILKSHFPYDSFPCGPPHETPGKYIYMSRNPKDVIVSLYCLVKQGHFQNVKWEKILKSQMEGSLTYGDYFDHLLGWWAHRNDENVLFLKYEDRKKDLAGQIKQIATFMEADLSSQELSKVVELATFDSMKKEEKVNQSWSKNYDKDGEPVFLRKGVVGDWKNFFTPEESREMDIRSAEKLEGTGLEFEYD